MNYNDQWNNGVNTHDDIEAVIKAKFAELEAAIENDGTDIAALSRLITGLRTDINGLIASYPAGKVTISGYSSLLAKLSAMDEAIAAAAETGGDLSDYYNKTDVDNLLATKANSSEVVKSISVNGQTQQKDTNGNVNIQVQGGGQVTVTTNNDGTFTIHSGDNTYTINLNHTHENMAKLRIVDEEPSDPARDTIYVLVNDAEQPQEIQSLWIAGLEFVGGGGSSEPDTTPKLSSPKNNATLDFSGAQSTTLVVKGKNLTSPLSVTATGDFTVTANGSSVSSIAATDANDGITLTLTKGNGFDENGGSLKIEGLLDDVAATINVIDSKILPGGLVADTAWNGANQVGSNPEVFSAPGFQSGYCTTPFYKVTYNGNLMQLFIKAGYVSNSQGTGDLPHAFDVFKHADTDATTDGAYSHPNDPQERKSANDQNKVHQWVSSTFKTSEIANCYIYDNVAQKYLFAGQNVDTSSAPNV